MPEAVQQIDDERQHNTQQDRCGDGEIYRCVFTPVDDVAGEASDGQVNPAKRHQYQASNQNYRASNNEDPA